MRIGLKNQLAILKSEIKENFNKNNMNTDKYVIYVRKSSEEDDRQVLSIEAQLVELKEFAAKEKLKIV